MGRKTGVIIMSALLVLYLVALGQLAVTLMLADDAIAKAIGIALLLLPLLGAWGLVAEILFGVRSARLATALHAEGRLPVNDLPSYPSGRPQRAAADAAFPAYRDEVEAEPDSWRAWFRLGLAYDASGDRKRAREAIRRAIRLERTAR